jgi:hypothetical protein
MAIRDASLCATINRGGKVLPDDLRSERLAERAEQQNLDGGAIKVVIELCT